jgi:acylphosphatase
MEQIARHIFFRGRVQGVGFRYTVRQIAGQYDLTGTVKNLPDGSVEAVLQGPPGRVQGCIDDIKSEFAGYIRQVDASEQVFNSHLADFSIIY